MARHARTTGPTAVLIHSLAARLQTPKHEAQHMFCNFDNRAGGAAAGNALDLLHAVLDPDA